MPSSTASPAVFGQSGLGRHADPDDDEIGRDRLTIGGDHFPDPIGPVEARHPDTGAQVDPTLSVEPRIDGADLLTQGVPERCRRDLEHRDGAATLACRRGDLGADEPGSDDDEGTVNLELILSRQGVVERTEVVNAFEVVPGDVQSTGCSTGGEQQLVGDQARTGVEDHLPLGGSDAGDMRSEHELDLVGVVEALLIQEDVGGGLLAEQDPLRQRRTVVREMGLATDENDSAVEAVGAERRCRARRPPARPRR